MLIFAEMSAIATIQQKVSAQLDELNALIASTLRSSNPLMNRVIETYLKTKGKQLRPLMVILSGRLLGTPGKKLISAAASVELLHNASLIHDDVVDETKLRRSAPTINGLWDNHIAVLVGDFFVSSSLQRALDTADLRIVEAIASLGKLLSLGEIDQIYNARYHRVDRDRYYETIDRKTASLFVACAQMGGYAVDAEPERIEPLTHFARLLGRSFQIQDDIFDYCRTAEIGKPTGHDLREGKITLPLIYALYLSPQASSPEACEMAALSRKESLTDEDVETLIAFAWRAGGIDYARQEMERMHDEGVALLRRAYPDEKETVDDLAALFDYTIERQK